MPFGREIITGSKFVKPYELRVRSVDKIVFLPSIKTPPLVIQKNQHGKRDVVRSKEEDASNRLKNFDSGIEMKLPLPPPKAATLR